MATTRDAAHDTAVTDRKLTSPNRIVATTPDASLTPLYVGEIVYDDVGKVYYKSYGLTNADWRVFVPST